jgi:hypothetical protein
VATNRLLTPYSDPIAHRARWHPPDWGNNKAGLT